MRVAAYERLVERGCLCGSETPHDCPLHGPGDNRGLRAFYQAGMPLAFPSEATCGRCGAASLLYPSGDRDDPTGGGLICPECSTPALEGLLRSLAAPLHVLNDRTVFGALIRPYPVRDMQALLDRGTPKQQADCKEALAESWHATEDGSDYTTDFPIGEDGRRGYYKDGPRPSFALALLFDHERFTRGESTVLEWEGPAESKAAA